MITHVAIRFQGKVYFLPKPHRHHHVITKILIETDVSHVDVPLEDEGFLDDDLGLPRQIDLPGMFLNRRQALMRAELYKQIKDHSKVRAGMLTSEDVW